MTSTTVQDRPVSDRRPDRTGRRWTGRRWARRLRSEPVLAPLGALALAVLMTWPAAIRPASTVPANTLDPLLVAWALGWVGYALVNQPLDFWQSNIFWPEPDSFALTESFLGYAPLSLVGDGPTAALVRYNVMYIVVAALAFGGAYALARQLGARWPGALVAGLAFAYCPWRIAQADHLHVLSTGGIALSLAALARGHGYTLRHGWRPETARPRWAVAGWLVACWQLTIGFGIGIPFGYVLGLLGVAAAAGWLLALAPWRERRALPWSLVPAHGAGAAAFGFTAWFMSRPYLNVADRNDVARRTVDQVEAHSPTLRGLITAPEHSWLWGDLHAGWRDGLPSTEMTVLPGFALIGLAACGLFVSAWSLRRRLVMLAVSVVVVLLSLGTNFSGRFNYLWLYENLTGWDALRTSGRLVIYLSLLLALLAAGFVTWLTERFQSLRPLPVRLPIRVRWTVAAVLPALLVFAEGIDTTPHPRPTPAPVVLKQYEAPVMVLPISLPFDRTVEWWSTDGYPKMVNGASGLQPPITGHLKTKAQQFPDAESVAYLRKYKVRTVVVLKDHIAGTKYAGVLIRPSDGLPLTRTETPEAVIFVLDR
jgi:hypothetical protein